MKQILQSLKSGEIELVSVPRPSVGKKQLLIKSSRTLVSAGTERMLLEFGRAGLIGKARQQPDKVRQALEKMRADGIVPTIAAILHKLDQPVPLGYCNVGVVVDRGIEVSGFEIGDRVVSNAGHAEAAVVPVNLCAKVPESVTNEQAAFAVIGAIALQGIRLAEPTLGECVVVIGLGLIGLMAVQLLRAQGCRVLGLDFDPKRLELAATFGAEVFDLNGSSDLTHAAAQFSRGRGVDAVLITASTKSNEPIEQAARISRKRGRIVLIGVSGLSLSRADFYEKELTFQVSCSYGPGRYDPLYEQSGFDYPVGFVRWTEQRNFEAVLDMFAAGVLDIKPLVTHEFDLSEAVEAFEVVGGSESSLGVLLRYSEDAEILDKSIATPSDEKAKRRRQQPAARASVSFIGAGNYATGMLIPMFQRAGARLRKIASREGLTAVNAARRFGFDEATTDLEGLLVDDDTNAVVISTRHDTHADLVLRALASGKDVYVEKPLALTVDQIDEIEEKYGAARDAGRAPLLMVGFNRRFAPHVQTAKKLLEKVQSPISVVVTVNAGAIPSEHWTQDPSVGGGRIVGEACHFIDLLYYLTGARPVGHTAVSMDDRTNDTVTIALTFDDGSIGTIHYFANGSKSYPKERIEIFSEGRILQLDNFRRLRAFGWRGVNTKKSWRQDKGQHACAAAFLNAIRDGEGCPIPYDEVIDVSRRTLAITDMLRN